MTELTRHWRLCAYSQAEAACVLRCDNIVHVVRIADVHNRSQMGAHEACSEFAYEFGGAVNWCRKK